MSYITKAEINCVQSYINTQYPTSMDIKIESLDESMAFAITHNNGTDGQSGSWRLMAFKIPSMESSGEVSITSDIIEGEVYNFFPAYPLNTNSVGTVLSPTIDSEYFINNPNCTVAQGSGLMLCVKSINIDYAIRTNLPIFKLDVTLGEFDNCEEFLDGILAYMMEGDYSRADNAEELDAPDIDFVVNLDNDSRTAFVNWTILGAPNFDNIFFQYHNSDTLPKVEVVTSPYNQQIVMSYDNFKKEKNHWILVQDIDAVKSVEYQVDCDIIFSKSGAQPVATSAVSANGKNTLTVKMGLPDEDEGYTSQEDNGDDTSGVNPYGGVDALTTTYKLEDYALRSFGNFLWSKGLLDDILLLNNTPIENVISLKAIPFDLDTIRTEPIILGNVNSGLTQPVTKNVYSFELPEFTVPRRKDGLYFLDYGGYTSISLYLPFIGLVQLNNDLVIGRRCKVKYIIDVITGSASVVLYVHVSGGSWSIMSTFSGMIGIDIPLTSNNRAQTELGYINTAMGMIGNTVGGVTSIAAGNTLGGVGSLMGVLPNALNDFAKTQFHSFTKGDLTPLVSSLMENKVFVTIVRPIAQMPSSFPKDVGRVCMRTMKLEKLKGYTRCINPNLTKVDCTWAAKEEISRKLNEGVYIR